MRNIAILLIFFATGILACKEVSNSGVDKSFKEESNKSTVDSFKAVVNSFRVLLDKQAFLLDSPEFLKRNAKISSSQIDSQIADAKEKYQYYLAEIEKI